MKFQGDPKDMMKLVCLALKKMEVEWQFDQKELKMKCRTKVDDNKLIDDDKFIEDFIRQQFLKFYVYVNKLAKNTPNAQQQQQQPPKKKGPPAAQNMDSSGKSLRSISSVGGTITDECYILNMYLLKGTVTVFLELADNFF